MLSHATKEMVVDLVRSVTYSQEAKTRDEVALAQLLSTRDRLPDTIRLPVQRFTESGPCHLLVKNLPDRKQDELLLVITALVGSPFAHADEGALVMHAKPRPHTPAPNIIAYCTWDKFDLDTELPYVHVPPDFVALWCINNVPGGFTYVASVERALNLLSSEQVDQLVRPQYLIPIPPHFGQDKRQQQRRPLLTYDAGRPRLRVRFDGLESDTREGLEASQALREALDTVREAFELEANSLLIINNTLSAHGRASFTPTSTDRDRELHRVYPTTDVTKYGNNYDPSTRRTRGF